MTAKEIAGLIASQSNPDYQQLVNNWTPYDPSINQPLIPGPTTPQIPSYFDYESARKTRVPARDFGKDYHEAMNTLAEYLNREKNQKSPVAALLDDLFEPVEKVDFLESLGYRFLPNSSYMVKGEVDPEFKRTFTMEEAFYIEMRIKLKNILLSKQALKFKI